MRRGVVPPTCLILSIVDPPFGFWAAILSKIDTIVGVNGAITLKITCVHRAAGLIFRYS